jgi:hypothetical protein
VLKKCLAPKWFPKIPKEKSSKSKVSKLVFLSFNFPGEIQSSLTKQMLKIRWHKTNPKFLGD